MICSEIGLVHGPLVLATQCREDTNVCDFGDVCVKRKWRVLGDEAGEVDVTVREEGSH